MNFALTTPLFQHHGIINNTDDDDDTMITRTLLWPHRPNALD